MKKVISLGLCILMLVSTLTVSISGAELDPSETRVSVKDAIKLYEDRSGEKVNTNRYYFLMPNGENGMRGTEEVFLYNEYAPSWYNSNTDTAGVYWWDSGIADPEKWPGYTMEKSYSDDVYYADVPELVNTLVFNNYVNGGMDPQAPIYQDAYQTSNIYTSYDKGDSTLYPDGLDNCDGMIYVINPSLNHRNECIEPKDWPGEWYYYYGDGCYGTVKDGNTSNCIRDDHDHDFLFKDKFIDQFISEYETEIAKYMAYEEQYYHYDENGEIDWALIYADKYITEPWNYHIIYEDRILMYGSRHPFSFGYGIYDAKTGEFHDIITDKGRRYEFDLSAYDGLEEVFDSLKLGYPIGDANHDHELSILDVTHIQLVLAKLATFDSEDSVDYYHGYKEWSELGYPKYISDINCDGERNIMDATAIQLKLAGLE